MTSICGFEKSHVCAIRSLITGGRTEAKLTSVSSTTVAIRNQFAYAL
jgi:hypothetical protein